MPATPSAAADADALLRELSTALAQNLITARTQIGMSQRTLALQTGLARNYLIRIERGEANPTLSVLVALALVVGKRPCELIMPGSGPVTEVT